MQATMTALQIHSCDPRLITWDNPGLGIRCHFPEDHDGPCEPGPAYRLSITRDEIAAAVRALGVNLDDPAPCKCGRAWESHDEGSFLSSAAGHRWLTMCGKMVA